MTDSAIRSTRSLRIRRRNTLDSLCRRGVATLACATSMLTATPLAAWGADIDRAVPITTVPITTDPTATIVRLAPRILISNPAEINVSASKTSNQSRRHWNPPTLVSQATFSSLHQAGQAPAASEPSTQQPFESLPRPSADNTVEVEVEVPALVQPVPVSQPPGLLPIRREPAAESNDEGSRTFDSFDDPQPELIESDVLDLGDRQFGRDVMRHERVTVPTQSTGAWLDVRPRGLGESSQLVADADLPGDTSGLPRHDSVPHLTSLHRSDLTMRDFWTGASFCHQPLYFEDNRLERYGAIRGPLKRVPAVHSGIHFAWKAGVLPLSAAIDPPCSSVRSGYHTPPLKRLIR